MAGIRTLANAWFGVLLGTVVLTGCRSGLVQRPMDSIDVVWLEKGVAVDDLRGLVCVPLSRAAWTQEHRVRDGERLSVRWAVFNCTGSPLFVNTLNTHPDAFVKWRLIPEWNGAPPKPVPFGPLSGPTAFWRPEARDHYQRLPPVDPAKLRETPLSSTLLVEVDVYVGRKGVLPAARLWASRMLRCYPEGRREQITAVASREIRIVYD